MMNPRYKNLVIGIAKRKNGLTNDRWNRLAKETKIMLVEDADKEVKKMFKEIYGSMGAYANHFAKLRGFLNYWEYQKSNLIERGFARPIDYRNWRARAIKFSKYSELLNYQATQKGYKNRSQRQRETEIKKGFVRTIDYKNYLAKKRGFKDYYEYRVYLKNRKKEYVLPI